MERFFCNICGVRAGGVPEKWMNEVRALYIKGHLWSEPMLTGVGYEEGDIPYGMSLPSDPMERYDSSTRNISLDVMLRHLFPLWESIMTVPLPHRDPNEPSLDDLNWGFIFHESCWQMLQEASFPDDINVRDFMSLCRSIPTSADRLNWGHDYGGLMERGHHIEPDFFDDPDDEIEELPAWAHAKFLRYTSCPHGRQCDCGSSERIFEADPLQIPWLQNHLKESLKRRSSHNSAESVAISGNLISDCFSLLPYDIRELLLHCLPSKDVLSAFLASKSLAKTPLSQSFWRSRFCHGREYDYIFEAWVDHKKPNYYREWKYLYMLLKQGPAKESSDEGQLENRKRIWRLLSPLTQVLHLIRTNQPQGVPCASFWEPNLHEDKMRWQYLGESQPLPGIFGRGTQSLYTRSISLPESYIVGANIYLIGFNGLDNVTGITFFFQDGQSVDLGYTFAGHAKYISLEKSDTPQIDSESPYLLGFKAWTGISGFHALFIITSHEENRLVWVGKEGFGYDEGVLRSTTKPLKSIKAHFDAFKMVALGIPAPPAPQPGVEQLLDSELSPEGYFIDPPGKSK